MGRAIGLGLLGGWGFLLSGKAAGAVTNALPRDAEWITRSWGTQNGLPQNNVYALLQSRDGYLWVGTGGGLARFDGTRFHTFGLQDGLRSVQISALAKDLQGELWVGTQGGGLSRWAQGRFTTFAEDEGLASSTVTALVAGKDGTLWIGTPHGLIMRSGAGFARVTESAGVPQKHIYALLEDSGQNVWVSTLDAVYRGSNGHFERAEVSGPPLAPVYAFYEDREGCVWAGGGNGNLWRFAQKSCEHFVRTNGVPFEGILCMAQGREGPLWIGTRAGGLFCYVDGTFRKVIADGFPNATANVMALFVDRDGAVWAGTDSGLHRLSPKRLRVWGTAEGLEHQEVMSVAEDPVEGFWIATRRGGLYRLRQGRFSRMKEPSTWFGYPYAYTVLAGADGSIWAAGESFLYRFHSQEETRVYIKPPIANEAIRASCEDDNGVWLGTYYGTLLKADANGPRIVLANGSLPGEIRSLVREGPESLWIGTAAGLCHWQAGKIRVWRTQDGLLSASIAALLRDPDGTLWIGTLGGGLSRLKNGRIVNVTSRNGLPDDSILQIVADDLGHLWLGCNHGLIRLERAQLDDFAEGSIPNVRAVLFGGTEGMVSEQCTGGHSPTAIKSRNGRLLFPTANGLVEIDPRQWVGASAVPPETSIEEVRVDGEVRDNTQELVLAPGSRNLAVTYNAPSFRDEDLVRFRFRLEPLDKKWVDAGTRRTASYGMLNPGRYTFRVIASVNEGEWHERGATLAISVQPQYWQTWWFRALLAAGLCAAGSGSYLARVARLKAKHAAQEALTRQLLLSQENERKRVAAELHDGLGQDLLLIKNRVELLAARTRQAPETALQLLEISRDASRALTNVRTISHALRPAALEQIGLTKAIEWMVRQVTEASQTNTSTELDNIDGILEPDQEISLYRVVQEALTNALKHAQATQVIVEIKRQTPGVWASVFDNGRGFEVDGKDTADAGFGLAGMRERAKVLGGQFEIQSTPGTGTRISVSVPLSGDQHK